MYSGNLLAKSTFLAALSIPNVPLISAIGAMSVVYIYNLSKKKYEYYGYSKTNSITIEDLNVSGMMKNKHLSKAVASQKFYEFKTKIEPKCKENGIELRIVDRWFPSSKTCHCCKSIKKDLKLSDRLFRCDCGYCRNRFNAS